MYILRGKGDMTFEAPRRLLDKKETPVQLGEFWDEKNRKWGKTEGEDPTRDLCVYPLAVDWDGDGDLDLLLGGFRGRMAVRINEGTAAKPVFAEKNTPVKADGKILSATGGGVSPTTADWDGDGRWDLICGRSKGEVVWYRNTASKGMPTFAAAQTILEKPGEKEADRPCSYLKVAVGDINHDKKLDLVVGAYDAKRTGGIWVYLRR